MFTNFIYFIVVLLIFSTQQPSPTPRLSLFFTFASGLTLLFLFGLINRQVFRGLAARMSGVRVTSHMAVLYHRVVTRQSILALVFFCAEIYLLDIKYYLTIVSLIRFSFTLQGLAGLVIFLLHLAIVWFYSFECRCRFSSETCSRGSIVTANLKFNLAILLPWLLISGSFDLMQLLPLGSIPDLLDSPVGQILFFALLMIIFMILAPPLVVRLWSCQPLAQGTTRSLIERFCQKENFEIREIVLWPGQGGVFITAGVMGLIGRYRYLLVTQGLLDILDDEELRAVLAHEMGHVKEHHLFFYLLFLLGYVVLAYPISGVSLVLLLTSDLPLSLLIRADHEFMTLISILSTLPLLVLLVFYFRFLFGFFIRNFERQADLYGLSVMNRAYPLISALEKVAFHSGNIRDVPSWHHFSIKERVDFLTEAAGNPSLIRKHRGKIRKALAGYLVGVVAVGVFGYLFYTGAVGKQYNEQLNLKMLSNLVQLEPDNPLLQLRLGTLYYTRNQPKQALFHLQRALTLDGDNPDVLNNLAWVFATSKETPLFQPKKALVLAEQAAAISQQPHILDTLAESYYVNGLTAKALATAEKALATASGDRAYYIKQVERFRRAVEEITKQ
jgi:Zn-dependent protease with chaperone function